MNHLIALFAFGVCFALMAVGLIVAKKALRKGCGDDPSSCACGRQGRPPEACDNEKK
jgi:hypothetical protein